MNKCLGSYLFALQILTLSTPAQQCLTDLKPNISPNKELSFFCFYWLTKQELPQFVWWGVLLMNQLNSDIHIFALKISTLSKPAQQRV